MIPLLVSIALADIAPPNNYVETCTIAIQCGPDIAGKTCDAAHDDRSACEALETDGWFQMCQTWGASVWTEVFCETQPNEAERQARIDAAERKCGCSAPVGPVGLLAWLPVALLVARRRRR